MTRPRYEEGAITAREKIANAFWEMLEGTAFSDITVRALARRAQVNHNTFYRYFDGIEQMAAELFDESIVRAIPAAMLSASGDALDGLQFEASNLHRAILYARSGSDFLQGLVRDSLMNAWLDAACVDVETLTVEQRVDCDIIFGGIVAAMGDPAIEFDSTSMARLASRPLGKGMLASMRDIALQDASQHY